MKDRVPACFESLFNQRFRGQRLGLHELMVFAAALLDLVHSESLDVLQIGYANHSVSLSESLLHTPLDRVMFHSMDTAANTRLTYGAWTPSFLTSS